MNKKFISAAVAVLCLAYSAPVAAQAEPDYNTAINQLNLFNKQCFGNFPDFSAVRADARNDNWVVGPLAKNGEPVSWAVNEGSDNFSLMLIQNPSNSSMTCEVRGKTSEETLVGVFHGIYAERIRANRTGAPENSWMTPNGLVTIKKSPDGRSTAILSK